MRLDDARLCLDCEEIHEEQECPACGSEVFAFLTRWIQSTAPDKGKAAPSSTAAHSRSTPAPDHLAAWRQIADGTPANAGRGKKIVARSILGLAAMGIAGWAWARTAPSNEDDDS